MCVKYFILVFFYILTGNAFAKKSVYYDTGGQLNFTIGRIAGVRSAEGVRISGYGWLSAYYPLNNDHSVKAIQGVSVERSGASRFLVNDMNIGYFRSKDQIIIGRTMSAAAVLHHDISDFGAPGGGIDNSPISFFFADSFTTNVAQQLVKPFTERIAYYVKPYANYLGFGISYAPRVNIRHPFNYQFFADAPVKNEISFSGNVEFKLQNYFFSFTNGYTQADRQFNRFNNIAGKISAHQSSVRIRQKLYANQHYRLYELNNGCLKDARQEDCRAIFQYSKIQDTYIRNIGTQMRFVNGGPQERVYNDFFIGWSWFFQPNMRVGAETIYRIEKAKNTPRRTDFHWLIGMAYQY